MCVQDRTTFRRIVVKNAFQKRKKYEGLLESVPLLKSLDVSKDLDAKKLCVHLSACMSVFL